MTPDAALPELPPVLDDLTDEREGLRAREERTFFLGSGTEILVESAPAASRA